MDSKPTRKAASDDPGELFEQTVGDPWDWGVEAIHHTSLIIKYADVVTDEPGVTKITPGDVVDYFWNYHGSKGFEASYRFLGSMGGDWRPIDELANMCLAWFKAACRPALVNAAARHGMTFIS
jgi:hypothetical protein